MRAKFNLILGRHPLTLMSIVLFTCSFLLAKYWIIFIFPDPEFMRDAVRYMNIARDILDLSPPSFFIRGPGFPLFQASILFFSETFHAIVIAHVLCAWLSSLALITSFGLDRDWLSIPIAATLGLFYFLNVTSLHETLLYSESFFTSLTIFTFSCLLFFVAKMNPRRAILLSLSAGFMIWTRINSIYILGILGILCLHLLWNRHPKHLVLCLLIPCLSMLGLLTAYNGWREDLATLSPAGGFNMFGPGMANWRTSSDFPDDLNQRIRKATEKIPSHDLKVMRESWDVEKIWQAYQDNWSPSRYGSFSITSRDYQEYYKEMGTRAIIESPMTYLRFVYAMAVKHFFLYPKEDTIRHLYAHFYRRVRNLEERNDDNSFASYRQLLYEPKNISDFKEKPLLGFIHPYYDFLSVYIVVLPWMRNGAWPWIWISSSLAMLVIVIRQRFRNPLGLVYLSIALAPLASGAIVSAVEVTVLRYSYPLEFVYYISPILLISLIPKPSFLSQIQTRFFQSPLRRFLGISLGLSASFFIISYTMVVGAYGDDDPHQSLSDLARKRTAHEWQSLPAVARLLTDHGRPRDALDAVEEALFIDPNLIQARFEKSKALRKLGHLDLAEEEEQNLFLMKPRNEKEIFWLGQAYLQAKQNEKAVELYLSARQNYPNFHPQKFQNLSPEVKAAWDRLLGVAGSESKNGQTPQNQKTLSEDEFFQLGQTHLQAKENEKAVELYRSARQIYPDFHPEKFQKLNPEVKAAWDRLLGIEAKKESGRP